MKKTLYIDADSLLYKTVFARSNTGTGFEAVDGGDDIGTKSYDMKALKSLYRSLVSEIITSCEVESAVGRMAKFNDVKTVFTSKTNFRFDIFPDYKSKRKDDKPKEFYKLKKWAVKKGIVSDKVEADDIVSYYARQGHPIASADKDVLYQTPGYHYDMFHKVFVKTTKKDANRFLCLQSLMGDAGDGIPGLPKCGVKTAEKYLDALKTPTLDDVIKIYKDKGFPKEDAITQIRLVHMGQVEKINKKGKIKVRLYS